MNKRTWHYIMSPMAFECTCPKCGGSNLEWSEYESHIWCYDCKIDFDPEDSEYAGVFSGPIPIQTSVLIGLSFDKYIMQEDRIERFNIETGDWDKEWFFYDHNFFAKHLLLDDLDHFDDRYGDIIWMKGSEYIECQGLETERKRLYAILRKYKIARQ